MLPPYERTKVGDNRHVQKPNTWLTNISQQYAAKYSLGLIFTLDSLPMVFSHTFKTYTWSQVCLRESQNVAENMAKLARRESWKIKYGWVLWIYQRSPKRSGKLDFAWPTAKVVMYIRKYLHIAKLLNIWAWDSTFLLPVQRFSGLTEIPQQHVVYKWAIPALPYHLLTI